MKQINLAEDLLAVVYGGGEPAVEAAKALAGLREWIPVSERLPLVGVEVLASENGGAGMLVALRRKDGHWYGGGLSYLSVTHWMPLPKRPQ